MEDGLSEPFVEDRFNLETYSNNRGTCDIQNPISLQIIDTW